MSTITPHATATGVARYKRTWERGSSFLQWEYGAPNATKIRVDYQCRSSIRLRVRLVVDYRVDLDSIFDCRLPIYSIVDLRSDCQFLSVDFDKIFDFLPMFDSIGRLPIDSLFMYDHASLIAES